MFAKMTMEFCFWSTYNSQVAQIPASVQGHQNNGCLLSSQSKLFRKRVEYKIFHGSLQKYSHAEWFCCPLSNLKSTLITLGLYLRSQTVEKYCNFWLCLQKQQKNQSNSTTDIFNTEMLHFKLSTQQEIMRQFCQVLYASRLHWRSWLTSCSSWIQHTVVAKWSYFPLSWSTNYWEEVNIFEATGLVKLSLQGQLLMSSGLVGFVEYEYIYRNLNI